MKEKEKKGIDLKRELLPTYSRREFLNQKDSPSTGFVIAYDGMINDDEEEEPYRATFLKVGDCYSIVKLHKASYDTMDDFIEKMEKLKDVIGGFIDHLKMTKNMGF